MVNIISLDLSTSVTVTPSAKTLGTLTPATTGTNNRITMISAITFTTGLDTTIFTPKPRDLSKN
jgi:hypothetical protein